MDELLFDELFEPSFVYDEEQGLITRINYHLGVISGKSPRKISRKYLAISDFLIKSSEDIVNLINEARGNSEVTISHEISDILNGVPFSFVCKIIPLKDSKTSIVLINDVTIEKTLHSKYNMLIESAKHVHRKIYDSYYMISRIPVTVPAALSYPFRDTVDALIKMKKHLVPGKDANKQFNIIRNSLTRISNVSVNIQYLHPNIAHKEVEISMRDLFYKHIVPRINRTLESYLNPIQVDYFLSPNVLDLKLHLDITKTTHAIVSVIDNACESVFEECAEKPKVEVEAYFSDFHGTDVLTIDVIDNGLHMKSEHQKKMYAPFYSGFDEIGLGLGLTVAKRCIEDHGGDITFDPVYIDGNRFRIRLPHNDDISLNSIACRYKNVYFYSYDLDSRLVINNYLKTSGVDYECILNKEQLLKSFKNIKNDDCLLIEYFDGCENILIDLKLSMPSLSIILLMKINNYGSFLNLNEKIRIKDVIIYPPTYDLIIKVLKR